MYALLSHQCQLPGGGKDPDFPLSGKQSSGPLYIPLA